MANTLEVAINSDAAKRGATQFNQATKSMGRHADKLDRKVDRLDAGMLGLGAAAKGVGKLVGGMFAGIGALGILRGAISAMAKFEETMAVVRGVTGATHEEFVQLSAQAKILGANTRFSATQAGEGLLFLARAGFTVDQALAAIEPTLKFAQANVIDLGQAADIVSNIMTQFGIAAEETARATDVLTLTANSANTNILQLSEGMKFVGPIAGALGRTIEETSAAIGMLGNSGIQASLAGTSLRAIMLALVAPTTQAEEAITGLGLTMQELDPITTSLTDIFKKLRDAELGAEEANAIFGRRAVGAALQLAKNVEQLGKLEEELKNSAGAVEALAALMDDTLVGAAKNVTSAFEAVALQTGESGLVGVLKSLLNAIADAVRLMVGFKSNLDDVTEGAKTLAFALQLVGGALTIIVAQKAAVLFGLLAQKMALVLMSAGPLASAFLAMGVGIAAFRIGAHLFDEFRIVQEVSLKAVTFIGGVFVALERDIKTVWAAISFAAEKATEGMVKAFTWSVTQIGALIKKIEGPLSYIPGFGGMEGTGQDVIDWADKLGSSMETKPFLERMAELKEKSNASLALLAQVEKEGLENIEKEFKGKGNKGVDLMTRLTADFAVVRDKFLEFFATDNPNMQNLKDGAEAFSAGLQGFEPEVIRLTGAMKLVDDVAQDAGRTMAMAFEDVVVGAKSASEAIKALAQDIARLVVRQAVTEPLAASISAGMKGFAEGVTVGGQYGVTGGKIGPPTLSQSISRMPATPAPLYASAPTVNIVNNSGGNVEASGIDFDPREFVVSVVIDDVRHNGPIRNALGEG